METTEKIVESYCRYVKQWFTIPTWSCIGMPRPRRWRWRTLVSSDVGFVPNDRHVSPICYQSSGLLVKARQWSRVVLMRVEMSSVLALGMDSRV